MGRKKRSRESDENPALLQSHARDGGSTSGGQKLVSKRGSSSARSQRYRKLRYNPHLYQLYADQPCQPRKLPIYPREENTCCIVPKALPRTLIHHGGEEEASPREVYRPRKDLMKTVIHWGQRKLFLAELEFLTEWYCSSAAGSKKATVLYAGAAPGTHIPYLASLFPQFYFILIDPLEFSIQESGLSAAEEDNESSSIKRRCGVNVQIRQEFFTKKHAEYYANKRQRNESLLFICDVRTADCRVLSEEETETAIQDDMSQQQYWTTLLQPDASMLKFRLPWSPGTTDYLQGEMKLPVWGPPTTTEGRLVVKGPPFDQQAWDHEKYMEQMFYFNTVTRLSSYEHPVHAKKAQQHGLDHCYDCTAEISILSRYLNNVEGREPSVQELVSMVRQISKQCSNTGRTLQHPTPDPSCRSKWYPKRIFGDNEIFEYQQSTAEEYDEHNDSSQASESD
eukprot:gb/GECG01001558.1/.p1 GENE.gb/GECG01001558.1/~~gb/GECG01001558.1/.p1  ORF type:complete len:452 (+),score=53.80 gb/GECG01001558.1/:1-1356(+)